MKYSGMPAGMWMLFKKQFRNALVADLGYGFSDANRITKAAKTKYREIIEKLPEFEKGRQIQDEYCKLCASDGLSSLHGQKTVSGRGDPLL